MKIAGAVNDLLSYTEDLVTVYRQLAETDKAIIERRDMVLADQFARGSSVAAAEREAELGTEDLRITREENIRDVKILSARRETLITLISASVLTE